MRPTRSNIGEPKFPPNPNQWAPERNGHNLRARFERPVHHPLDPFEIAGRFDGVELVGRAKFEQIIGSSCASELFGRSRNKWSGFVLPVMGLHLVVVNHTHSPTRQNATLTEELFHITLKHAPSKIFLCPLTGLLRREYTKEIEDEAYWSAAAGLLPYVTLKALIQSGSTIESIADAFGVSVDLVQFRMKVTKLWKQRR
jgi:uncharacterized protein DUF955